MSGRTRHLRALPWLLASVTSLAMLAGPALAQESPTTVTHTHRPSLQHSEGTPEIPAKLAAPGACEDLRYTWHLRGGLAWIASFAFPTSGVAEMRTWHDADDARITSQLQISAPGRPDYYRYETEFEIGSEPRTLMTYHGYAWGRRERHERTFFDYAKKLSRRRKETPPDPPELRVEKIPDEPLQDVLTGIFYLREHATDFDSPMPGEIYSDGNLYSVVYSPAPSENAKVRGTTVQVKCFEIGAADDASDRWGGGLKICVTGDEERIPTRIIIKRGRMASLDLQLIATSTCNVADGGIQSPTTGK